MPLSSTRRAFVGAVTGLLLLSACAAADDPGSTATTAAAGIESIAPATPEGLVTEIVAAMSVRDDEKLRVLLPGDAYGNVVDVLFGDFVAGESSCDGTQCILFDADWPRALMLTVRSTGSGWVVDHANIESTN